MDGTTTSTSTAAVGEMSGLGKGLVCHICGVSFEQSEEQRGHVRADWHVYNLKRKIASLPPISQSVFKKRLENERIQDGGAAQDTSSFFKKCPGCEKEFYSLKAWGNHVEKSRCTKEIELELGLESGMDALALNHDDKKENDEVYRDDSKTYDDSNKTGEEGGEATEESFSSEKCLFCPIISDSLDTNVIHMHRAHGLFIPDQDYLIDLTSLLSYFHIIINDFHECLYCGKDFSEGGEEAVRMHMIAKGHCNISLDDIGELDEFYEFGDGDGDEDEEGEEEFGEGKARGAEILTPGDDGTIHLPSGKTLGHRSQFHLYRRNTHNYRGTPAERLAQQKLALEELKSVSSHDESPSESAAEGIVKDTAKLPKDKISMAIQKLGMGRVRGVNGGQVMMRKTNAMSLAGLSESERKAVIAMERKTMRVEMRTRNQMRANMEKEANHQKTFRPDDPGRRNG